MNSPRACFHVAGCSFHLPSSSFFGFCPQSLRLVRHFPPRMQVIRSFDKRPRSCYTPNCN